MRAIDASEATARFAALVERAARGEAIVITRRCKPVARLVPAQARRDATAALAALARIRARARAMKLGRFDWVEWKAYRDRGRC